MINQKCKESEASLSRIIDYIRDYNAILWAGSGLSLYAGYPSGKELRNRILESAENEQDKTCLLNQSSLMDISQEYEQLYSREKLINILRNSYDLAPTETPYVHAKITKIPQIETIITTNYDHLFEMAYNTITVISNNDFKRSTKGIVDLYKIHGDTSTPSSIVLTSKDYARFYDKLDSLIWSKIKALLAEHIVIFIGYSLEDKNIQDLFEKILSQITVDDKEFFIVTPEIMDHKLRYLNSICKTTHVPMMAEEFIDYIEKEIRRNIVLDAMKNKVSIEDAYKICREHGITPTIRHEPHGDKITPVVEQIALSPELFFDYKRFLGYRGMNFTSSSVTYEDVLSFLEDCDCRELIIPADDVELFQDVNGINIPENHKINGHFPDVAKLVKQEMIESVDLIIGENNSLGCSAILRGFGGTKRSRLNIELASVYINVLYELDVISLTIKLRYPHTTSQFKTDLLRLEFWCNGNDLRFFMKNRKEPFIIKGFSDAQDKSKLSEFIKDKSKLYELIQIIENDIRQEIVIRNEITADDIDHIYMAINSKSPQVANITEPFSISVGKITYDQLEQLCPPMMNIVCRGVILEDCFTFQGMNIDLGTRNIRINDPYIMNIDEVKTAIANNEEVIIKYASKTNKAILQYSQNPRTIEFG